MDMIRMRARFLLGFSLWSILAWTAMAATFDVNDFGADPTGEALSTGAIQAAVDAADEAGGGIVTLPPGRYLSGPVFLKSNLVFRIETGATLVGIDDMDAYPLINGRWEGIDRMVHASLLTGTELENLVIEGGGTIDGNGEVWWEATFASGDELRRREREKGDRMVSWEGLPLDHPRPRVINLYHSRNIVIRDLRIIDSPSWTIHPVYCRNLLIEGITILAPYESPNTDGINPDSCVDVRISDCDIHCGDDAITLKSGYNEYGREVGRPTENVVISNVRFGRGHGGLVIGSEMSGDVRNVTISNCVFRGTDRAVRIKTMRGRGGVVEYIRADNLVLDEVRTGLNITMTYGRTQAEPVGEGTPRVSNIAFSNITGHNVHQAVEFIGLDEMPIRDIVIDDVDIQAAEGIRLYNVEGLDIRSMRLRTASEAPLDIARVKRLNLAGLTCDTPMNVEQEPQAAE